MPLWDQLKTRAADMNTQLNAQVSKFKNKEFAKASMAVCALIAAADGTIDPAERSKVAGFITSNPALQAFNVADLRADFEHFCNALSSDYDFGKIEAIQAISKVKSKPDQARAVIQVGIVIGAADGDFDRTEKAAVREACFAAGISPDEFDLN